MTLFQKILVGFSIMLLLGGLLGWGMIWSMSRVDHKARTVSEIHMPAMELMARLDRGMEDSVFGARCYVLTGDDRFLSNCKRGLAEVDQALIESNRFSQADTGLGGLGQLLGPIRKQFEQFRSLPADAQACIGSMADNARQLKDVSDGCAFGLALLVNSQQGALSHDIDAGAKGDALHDRSDILQTLSEMSGLLHDTEGAYLHARLMRDPKEMIQTIYQFNDLSSRIDQVASSMTSPRDKKYLDDLKSSLASYQARIRKEADLQNQLDALLLRQTATADSIRSHCRQAAQTELDVAEEDLR